MKHFGRKLYHILGGVGLLSLYFLLGRENALVLDGVLVLIVLLFEIARLTVPDLNAFVATHFTSFIRTSETHQLTGTIPYILGIGLSLYAYTTSVASVAIVFLAFGDVAATTIGERFGKTKIGDKSLEGTFAFVAAALAAGSALHFFGIGLPFSIMLLGAIAAAGIELLPRSINDNFSIPLLSGAIMQLALRWVR